MKESTVDGEVNKIPRCDTKRDNGIDCFPLLSEYQQFLLSFFLGYTWLKNSGILIFDIFSTDFRAHWTINFGLIEVK